MDHDETQNPFSPPMPFPPNTMPFSDSLQFEFESRSTGAGESLLGVPQPLECLYETPVPPFLLKTFDLVDDPSLDTIISWGAKGNSFVVWDHVEFARMILPKNFKHNNFSSFVRQLNTYGFRKIDADKWEFANEDFLRGQRHLLKNIQRLRRKSPPSQQIGSSSSETGKAELEDEVERLIKERSSILREITELQHQQRGTVQHMEVVNEKLNVAEKRQKHMVSFLARMFQNPLFLARLKQTREKTRISSPKTMRKIVKHQKHEPGTPSSSPEGQIMKCELGLGNFKESPSWHLEDTGENPVLGSEFGAFQVGDDSPQDELEMVNELLNIPELVPTLGTIDPLMKGKGIVGHPSSSKTEYFGPFPDNNNISEFSVPVMDNIWNMGFEASAGMSSSSTELWGNFISYNVPESSCGLSDIWDAVSWHPAGSLEKEKWQDDDFPSYELENQDGAFA